MKQLTGLDASFLYMETATTFGHVTAGIETALRAARPRSGALCAQFRRRQRRLDAQGR